MEFHIKKNLRVNLHCSYDIKLNQVRWVIKGPLGCLWIQHTVNSTLQNRFFLTRAKNKFLLKSLKQAIIGCCFGWVGHFVTFGYQHTIRGGARYGIKRESGGIRFDLGQTHLIFYKYFGELRRRKTFRRRRWLWRLRFWSCDYLQLLNFMRFIRKIRTLEPYKIQGLVNLKERRLIKIRRENVLNFINLMQILQKLLTPSYQDKYRTLHYHLLKIKGIGKGLLFWKQCNQAFGFKLGRGGSKKLIKYTQCMLQQCDEFIRLKKFILGNAVEIERLKRRLILERIKCYRHFRYIHHLPANGQQTRSNAKHAKKHCVVPSQFCKDVFNESFQIGVKTQARLRNKNKYKVKQKRNKK